MSAAAATASSRPTRGDEEGEREGAVGGEAGDADERAMIEAETWPPMAPPIERMIVFMPVATPV